MATIKEIDGEIKLEYGNDDLKVQFNLMFSDQLVIVSHSILNRVGLPVNFKDLLSQQIVTIDELLELEPNSICMFYNDVLGAHNTKQFIREFIK